MRNLGPDDYNTGTMVTVTAGPFYTVQSPFPPGMFGQSEPPRQEDKTLHGRVFKILAYDPPFIILEPLDGLGDIPLVRQSGPFAMLPYDGNFTPDAIKLNTKMGVILSEVSPEYAAAYQKHFCPPRQQPPQQMRPQRSGDGPITQMLENGDHDCDHCAQRGGCHFEEENRSDS